MKNKNGFTLVELLAIIVLIAVIALAAAPNFKKQIEQEDKEEKKILKQKIENASKLYVAKYYADASSASFTLTDLERDGLLKLKDSECDNEGVVSYVSAKGDDAFSFSSINCMK